MPAEEISVQTALILKEQLTAKETERVKPNDRMFSNCNSNKIKIKNKSEDLQQLRFLRESTGTAVR